MVVLFRPTNDMLDYSEYVDVIVLPVSCMGSMDYGLAKSVSEKYPEIVKPYKEACFEQTLVPGEYLETKVEGDTRFVLTLATTVSYTDVFTLDDLENVLLSIRRYLCISGREGLKVLMPILKVSADLATDEQIDETFEKVLGSLPNIITVTKRPEKIPSPFYFIGVMSDPRFMAPTLSNGDPNYFMGKEKSLLEKLLNEVEVPPDFTPCYVFPQQCNLLEFFLGDPIGVTGEKGWCGEHQAKWIVVNKDRTRKKENTQTLSRDLYLVSLANVLIYCTHEGGSAEGFPLVYDRVIKYRKDGVYKTLLTTWELTGDLKKEYEESWKTSL